MDPQHALIIRILHQPSQANETKNSTEKITRVAFLYMEGDEEDYAQCSSCFLYTPDRKRCAILGDDLEVDPDDTCALYIHGEPVDDQPIVARVTQEEAGYLKERVQCQRCKYGGDKCGLFAMLNKKLPNIFDLEEEISPTGCCNAFISK